MLAIIFLLSALNLSSPTPLAAPAVPILFERESSSNLSVGKYRTKQDIIWSCLATIFMCTWVAVHPNLPGPWDSQWARLKRKVVMLIYALVTPEFVVIWALRQWIAAGEIAKKFNTEQNIPVASNGWQEGLKNGIEEWFKGPYRNKRAPMAWTRTHGFFVQAGGFILYQGKTPVRVLEFENLLKGVMLNAIDAPDCTEQNIHDRGKGDFLTGLVAVLQTTWFIIDCLARLASRLPVTELEVVTLAFALLNGVSYVLWWKKPKNVIVAVHIQLKEGPSGGVATGEERAREDEREKWVAQQMKDCITKDELGGEGGGEREGLLRGGEEKESWMVRHMSKDDAHWLVPIGALVLPLAKLGGLHRSRRRSTLRVSMFSAGHVEDRCLVLPLLGIGMLFGGIHFISWSSSFPSNTEQCLWHVSTIVILLEPIALSLKILADRDSPNLLSRVLLLLAHSVSLIGVPFYLAARTILFVLVYTTLRQLPPDAYKSIEWTTFLPHV